MRFVIVGAGGVGGHLGVRLTEGGHDVAYLVRGRTLEALRETGIVLEAPQGIVRLGPQIAADDASALGAAFGAADCIVVTVKLYDLAGLAPRLAPLVGGDTAVLPLQNGVESQAILAAALGAHAPMKGVVSIKSSLRAPGAVIAKSTFCRIKFGESDGRRSDRAERIAAALNGCLGVSAELPADIDADIWSKFVMLASFSAVACMARATIGQVLANDAARTLMFEAVREAAAVARAKGIAIPGDIDDLVMKQVRDMPREGRPSMLEDLEAGRRLELPFLSGAVVRMARAHGIATPVHDVAYRTLSMFEGGRIA